MEEKKQEKTEETNKIMFSELDEVILDLPTGIVSIKEDIPQSDLEQTPEFMINQLKRAMLNYTNVLEINFGVNCPVVVTREVTLGEIFRNLVTTRPDIMMLVLKEISTPQVINYLKGPLDESKLVIKENTEEQK